MKKKTLADIFFNNTSNFKLLGLILLIIVAGTYDIRSMAYLFVRNELHNSSNQSRIDKECLQDKTVTVLPPKAAHVWVFLPEGAKKMQTLVKPKAEGESVFFLLLNPRMPRCEPTLVAGLTLFLIICQTNEF